MKETNPYQTPVTQDEVSTVPGLEEQDQQPSGLGGWLILVAIGLIFTPIRIVALILQVFVPLFSDGVWEILTTPGTQQYHELWAPLLIFEIFGNLVLFVAYIVLVYLFFRKSKYFPISYIVVAIGGFAFVVFDSWFATFVLPNEPMMDPTTLREIIRSAVGVAIWVPYMKISKRVRNTFVE